MSKTKILLDVVENLLNLSDSLRTLVEIMVGNEIVAEETDTPPVDDTAAALSLPVRPEILTGYAAPYADAGVARADYIGMMANIVVPIDEETNETIEVSNGVRSVLSEIESPVIEASAHSRQFDTVKAYYKKNPQLLLMAEGFCQWLIQHDSDDNKVIAELNHLQVIVRQRQLSVAEKGSLYHILADPAQSDYCKIGASILLQVQITPQKPQVHGVIAAPLR